MFNLNLPVDTRTWGLLMHPQTTLLRLNLRPHYWRALVLTPTQTLHPGDLQIAPSIALNKSLREQQVESPMNKITYLF